VKHDIYTCQHFSLLLTAS